MCVKNYKSQILIFTFYFTSSVEKKEASLYKSNTRKQKNEDENVLI